MTSVIDGAGASIPSETSSDSNLAVELNAAVKRRRPEEDDGTGGKRQRIKTGPAAAGAAAQQTSNSTTKQLGGFVDPHLGMRIDSLPILQNLSTQILTTLAKGPWEDTLKIITEPESELGQAYYTLKSLFDQTKKIYAQQDIFLSVQKLNIEEPGQQKIVHSTNLATFVSGAFAGDVGFYDLNDNFIETFAPGEAPLSREHGDLLTDLKTQVYISALSQEEPERSVDEILCEIFPNDLEATLQSHHPEIPLSLAEKEFVEGNKRRREYLKAQSGDVESIRRLSNSFEWENYLRGLSGYLNCTYGPSIAPDRRQHAPKVRNSEIEKPSNSSLANDTKGNATQKSSLDLFAEEAERQVRMALRDFFSNGTNDSGNSPRSDSAVTQPTIEHVLPQDGEPAIPHPPDQSAPTRVLYEKAREAAVAKSNPDGARRPILPSARRPWSQEEENALMAGLDLVKGPHWSQILNLYGAEGTVNDVLRDRNQVQLKDKARNLKLFFLKSNIEVPHYLQSVTGELKTRAPSQAAKREAEEQARLAGTDEQERVDGIMALNSLREQSRPNELGGLSPDSENTLTSQDQDSEEAFDILDSEQRPSDDKTEPTN